LIGLRHWTYRKRAITAFSLLRGDTVVDPGCGTGLNFSLLQEQIGPEDKIIGVDLTDAVLSEANDRVLARGWLNVELVKRDAALYVFPAALDGKISAFALTLVPEFDKVVRSGSEALRLGKRFVILDFKMPSGRFMKKAAPALAKLMTGPFGGTVEMATRKPWQSLNTYLALVQFRDLFHGGAYIAVGEKD
jgi:ubiquinone/menaquinone biosynthesis C-methylase UbiE